MNASTTGLVVAGLLLATAPPLHAQRVGADFAVRSGPVAGHVVISNSPGYSTYRRPVARRVVVVERYAPRVIVVERMRYHHSRGHWQRHGFRPVTVYYIDGRYFDRDFAYRRGGRAVIVYERGGRYYTDCDPYHPDRCRDGWDD